ncbi:60S ribosomal protein L2 [Hypoxylon texense]
MAKQHATEFEKIINAGRERKKNEALAARIFKRDSQRRSSAPAAGSLAGRAGVKKRLSSAARLPAGDINGEWTHDLHSSQGRKAKAQQDPTSLAARIHPPGTTIPRANNPRAARTNRTSKLANALERTASSSNGANQVNMRRPPTQPAGQGITIRGLAGPYVVMAQNFAPGTTAADIESAITPVGGLASSCRLVKTHPIVIAEIVFENKEGADRVIQTFNNQTADGRTLHVYLKPGGSTYRPAPPTGPRAQRDHETRQSNNVVVDGSMGFGGDLMDTDSNEGSRSNGGLYSDTLVPQNQGNHLNGNNSRRGRGFRSGR